MSECSSIDPLVTLYVDGELAPANRERVERHLRLCPPCYSRLTAERAVRDLLRERHQALRGACAPPGLRARCAATREGGQAVDAFARAGVLPAARPASWRGRLTPLAALLLFVTGGLLYQATESSTRVLAAELAADHLKCFTMNALLGTHDSSTAVEQSMASAFGWEMRLPAGIEGLELVGSRRCLYGEGQIAHIMYRHHGRPVSLFMLPRAQRAEQVVSALGQQCAIWSGRDRTFVLVSREARAEVEQLARVAQTAFR
jgi:anti-sigma factor RsiW